MKVVLPKTDESKGNKTVLLPLVPDPLESLTKENSVTFEVSTNPGVGGASKAKFTVRIVNGQESIRAIIKWKADVLRLLTGLEIGNTDAAHIAARFGVIQSLVRGTMEAAFTANRDRLATEARTLAVQAAMEAERIAGNNAAAQRAAGATVEAQPLTDHYQPAHVEELINILIELVVPLGCLAKIKRSLRRDMRKPVDMTVRSYYQHLLRINESELPNLPPFQPNQRLSDDEIVDILTYGCPRSWTREMDKQGFDPMANDAAAVVAMLERIELAEGEEFKQQKKSAGSNNNKKKSNTGSGGSKYCQLHGKGSHSTDECNTIKSQVKKLKDGSSGSSGGYKNKTWKRKADDESSKSKKDFNLFVKKMVQKELNAVSGSKKRKSAEANNIEKDIDVDIDLDNFNLDDWKNDDSSHESGSVNSEVST